MNRRWRVPLVLSAALILAQLAHVAPLLDVVRGGSPPDVHVAWPFTHLVLAPFTLTADWLNGGSRWDLENFGIWLVVGYVLARLFSSSAAAPATRRLKAEGTAAAFGLLAAALFVWWGARWDRPIPRLVASDSALIVLDVHSHTALSHDGRRGFGAAANAAWHARAGFDAAFVTDHNAVGAARQWRIDGAGRPPRLLPGEELSLAGLHILALGADSLINPTPWATSFDSSLILLDSLSRLSSLASRPILIASLPEFREHHWGADLGRLTDAGVRGFEVWTTSPRAMDLPSQDRATLIARGTSAHLALLGATDMHGLGNTASVWNVVRLPGWRQLSDTALTRALLASLRDSPGDVRVVALTRFIPASRWARAFAAPLGLLTALRAASRGHAVMLLLWIWGPALLAGRRKVAP